MVEKAWCAYPSRVNGLTMERGNAIAVKEATKPKRYVKLWKLGNVEASMTLVTCTRTRKRVGDTYTRKKTIKQNKTKTIQYPCKDTRNEQQRRLSSDEHSQFDHADERGHRKPKRGPKKKTKKSKKKSTKTCSNKENGVACCLYYSKPRLIAL